MEMYFDSHAHYWDRRFEKEAEHGAGGLLSSCLGSTVSGIVNVGTSPVTSRLAIEQAMQYPGMLAAAGIHPCDGEELPDITAALEDIRALFSCPAHKLVAVGEIGLDYHWTPFSKEKQADLFHRQMELAKELDLPVIIHDREAHGDCLEVVKAHPGVRGVFHSYSGSTEMARELISLGYVISFSGTVSFQNARRVAEVAALLPHDKVMIETDCPYLAPHPHRGELNHSGLLSHTAAAIAALWGTSTEEVAKITRKNAEAFFRI